MLNGQKTWSSRAAYAHWGFGLFRSDPESQRHHGLTYFCFPLDAEGVTVPPIAQLDGEPGFAEIFLDDEDNQTSVSRDRRYRGTPSPASP